jgi:hypothetical protein
MSPRELSSQQCRVLAQLRARNPGAEIALHQGSRGIVVEVRRGRAAGFVCVEPTGAIVRDQPVRYLA